MKRKMAVEMKLCIFQPMLLKPECDETTVETLITAAALILFSLNFGKNLPNKHTVKTLITAAALIIFSRNFGQNLLNKKSSLLRLLFKGGCYLSAALINVITVTKVGNTGKKLLPI